MKPQASEDPKIVEQALEWFDVLRRGDPEDRTAFAAWLKLSPRHVGEFLMVSAMYRQFGGDNPAYPIDIDALFATAATDNVLPLQTATIPADSTTHTATVPHHRKAAVRGFSRRRWATALAACVAMIALAGFWLLDGLMISPSYSTAVGELRSFELPDGSVVQLNTQSKVQVRFSNERRDIRLIKGEAMFQVAREAQRPFRVLADQAVIQALGTQFNVYRRPQGTTVAVLEGLVQVSTLKGTRQERPSPEVAANRVPQAATPNLSPLPTKLGAGEQINIERNGQMTRPASADAAQVGAWRERRLVFKANQLSEIAAEFNRYNREPRIRIADESIGERRLTGVFNADDPASLVQFLTRNSDLAADEEDGWLIIRLR